MTNRVFTYSAGGIVWRDSPRVRQVLLIQMRGWQSWMFPKGRVESGDAGLEATAQREVKEETGYDTCITDFAGFLKYVTSRGDDKIVFYWHMRPTGESDFLPSDEIEQYEWLTVREAVERLTHEREKNFLKQFANDDEL